MGAVIPRPRVVALALILVPLLRLAAPAAAGEVYAEGWEAEAWTFDGPGASRQCLIASTGSCALLLLPPAGTRAEADAGPLHLRDPWGGAVAFSFRAESDRGATDAVFEVSFDHGGLLRYHLATPSAWGGTARENLVRVESAGHGEARGLPWTPEAWHEAGFVFGAEGVQAYLDGRVFGYLQLPLASNVITGIRILASTPADARPSAFYVDDVRVTLRPPAPPADFRADAENAAGHVALSWTPPRGDVTEVRLTREGGGRPDASWTFPPDATGLVEDGLGDCRTYRYALASVGPAGVGEPATLTFTTLGCPERPAGASALALGEGRGVLVAWLPGPGDPRFPVTGYQVLRAELDGPETVVAEVAAPALSHVDETADPTLAYRYRVVALMQHARSAPSEPAATEPLPDVQVMLEDLGVDTGVLP